MRPLALTAALATALASSGCFVATSDPTGSVDLFWQFTRTKWDGRTVTYDPEVSAPAGTGVCATSGVDTVVVTLPGGSQLTLPCRSAGAQGVALDGLLAGRRTFGLDAYRGGKRLYSTTIQVDVLEGPPSAAVTAVADVGGVFDNLDVFFDFATAGGAVIANATCASEGVDYFTFNMADYAGTVVVSTTMFSGGQQPCSDLSPGPGVALDAVDRDLYTIRARAWRIGTALPIYDSCDTVLNTSATFLHDGIDTGVNGWPVLVLFKSCP